MRMSSAEFVALQARQNAKKKTDRLVVAIAKSEKSEAQIQIEIEGYLKSLGPTCYFVRCRMDVPSSYTRQGVPDFIGFYRGQPFALEVKKPGQKPTVEQSGDLLWAKIAGGLTGVVHSVEETAAALK